jgi:hypothetical protein
MAKYQKPDWITKNIANRFVRFLAGAIGFSPAGAHVLAVRGRKSGEWRTVPVNPLTFEGKRYLVAPRGETEWVRNLRMSRTGELRLGKSAESFSASELPDAVKPPVLRAYLKRWGWMTSKQFSAGADATDDDLRRIAPDHPVFEIFTMPKP